MCVCVWACFDVVFVANRVEAMLEQHVGKDQLIFPPFSPERVEELGEHVATDFDIMGAGWREVWRRTVGLMLFIRLFPPFFSFTDMALLCKHGWCV